MRYWRADWLYSESLTKSYQKGQSARWTLKPLYLNQIKSFEKSKSTLIDYFFDAVLLLTRN